jgi:hypothetical protein
VAATQPIARGAAAKKAMKVAMPQRSKKAARGLSGVAGHQGLGEKWPAAAGLKHGAAAMQLAAGKTGTAAAAAAGVELAQVEADCAGIVPAGAAPRSPSRGSKKRERQPRSVVGTAELISLGIDPQVLKSRAKKNRSPKGTIGRVELASLGLDPRRIKGHRQLQDMSRCTRRGSSDSTIE